MLDKYRPELTIPLCGLSLFILHRVLSRLRLNYLLKKKLVGKVVCITGSSSGIGKELARCCFSLGAKVVLVARRKEVLEAFKDELLQEHCARSASDIGIVVADLGRLEEIEQRANQILACFSTLDILINNAGISFRDIELEDLGDVFNSVMSVHEEVMRVNYFSNVALTKALLPHLIGRNQPTYIVAISSVQGQIALPYRSAYAASKFACQAFYDSLRAELAPCSKVRVLVASPGYVNTDLSLNAVTASGQSYGRMDKSTASGMSAVECARRVVEGVVASQSDVTIAPLHHRLLQSVRVLAPSLWFWAMRKRAAKEATEYKKQ